MSRPITVGSVGNRAFFRILDADGNPWTARPHDAAGLAIHYLDTTTGTLVSLTPTVSTWIERPGGWYALEVPDAVYATAIRSLIFAGVITGGTVWGEVQDVVPVVASVPTAGQNATAVRTELTTELANLSNAVWNQIRYRLGLDGAKSAPASSNPSWGDVGMTQLVIDASGTYGKVPIDIIGNEALSHLRMRDTSFPNVIEFACEDGVLALNAISADISGNVEGKVLGAGAGVISGIGVQSQLPDGAITDAKIATGALTSAKFAAGAFDAVWTVAARTLTTVADSAGITTLLSRITGLLRTKAQADTDQATIVSEINQNEVKIDGVKAKTDQLLFTGTNVNANAQVVSDKTGYGLSTAERSAIAVAVEQAILNDGDGQAILNAIVGAIGNQNIDQLALVAAIRADIERNGGLLDVLPTLTEMEASAVLAKQSNFTGLAQTSDIAAAAAAIIAQVDANETKIDGLVAAVRDDIERTGGMLDTVPTLSEIEASTVLAKQSGIDDAETNLAQQIDDVAVELAKVPRAVEALLPGQYRLEIEGGQAANITPGAPT